VVTRRFSIPPPRRHPNLSPMSSNLPHFFSTFSLFPHLVLFYCPPLSDRMPLIPYRSTSSRTVSRSLPDLPPGLADTWLFSPFPLLLFLPSVPYSFCFRLVQFLGPRDVAGSPFFLSPLPPVLRVASRFDFSFCEAESVFFFVCMSCS